MNTVNVGEDFSPYLTNRDRRQRDGAFSGEQFREEYLTPLDNKDIWQDSAPFVVLDFSGVKRLGPSWANEVFAFFTRYARPEAILQKIQVKNISRVKQNIIDVEIEAGYNDLR